MAYLAEAGLVTTTFSDADMLQIRCRAGPEDGLPRTFPWPRDRGCGFALVASLSETYQVVSERAGI